MAHYAQVVDGIVANVLTGEEADMLPVLEALGGKWVQTSYNTRDGVHYDENNQPSGKPALRLNFAQIGYRYDEKEDIFYPEMPHPGGAFYLDKKTMRYVMPMAVAKQRAAGMWNHSANSRKIYLTERGFNALGPQVRTNLTKALNIEWVSDTKVAELAFPVSDQETLLFAVRPEFDDIRPMSQRAMWNVTDRLLMTKLGIPVVPTWQGRTKKEVLALADAPFFVKRQRTHAKDTHPVAYTTWANPKAFVDAMEQSFWDLQAAPDELYGEFIFQPVLRHPFSALDLRIAVNKDSEVYVWCRSLMTYEKVDTLGRWVPFTEDCSKEEADIARVVKEQKLGPGIHLLQYAKYNDEWVLMDWNSRVTGVHMNLFPAVYPVLDDAFSWMLGLPLHHAADQLYFEQRSYRTWGVGREVAQLVGDAGLFARWAGDKLQRVAAIGTSKTEVTARYDELDRLLAKRNSSAS